MGIKTNLSACQAQMEMSGLGSRHRRLYSSLRSQALAPWMIRPRRDRAPRSMNLLGLNRLHGPSRDLMKVKRATVVGHLHRPIHPFLHLHLGRPDVGLNLIEVPVVRHRPVRAQTSGRLKAQDAVQISVRRTGAMQIGDLGLLNGEPPVVDRQIVIQELIRRVQRGDVRETHLLSVCGVRGMVDLGDQRDSGTG